jgi:hypothetical protein
MGQGPPSHNFAAAPPDANRLQQAISFSNRMNPITISITGCYLNIDFSQIDDFSQLAGKPEAVSSRLIDRKVVFFGKANRHQMRNGRTLFVCQRSQKLAKLCEIFLEVGPNALSSNPRFG